jgi:hypothetical protein
VDLACAPASGRRGHDTHRHRAAAPGKKAMNGKKILISRAYLQLLAQSIGADEVVDASDFAKFLNDLKWRLKGQQGNDELFKAIIQEEIHMFEKKDAFL